MFRRTLLFFSFLALLLLLPSFASRPAEAASCTNSLYKPSGQNFWVGDITSTNSRGPVVLFVHGYSSDHNTWTGGNYAVRDACNNGYRVAAVDLAGSGSIWDNAVDLKGKIQAITKYYGVSKVNIMAHSKGGLDTQTALVHYGAYPYIDTYIAFGSPFGGTDLADHACAWYGWALWQCNDATWSMRTSYMSYVRSITDGRNENKQVRAYVARGTKCDWYNPACAMISGADDGVVPAWSVWANASATRISDRSDLRHGEVHQTQRYGSWLFSYLGKTTAELEQAGLETMAFEADGPKFARSNYALRGGAFGNEVVETMTVEGGLQAVSFSMVSTIPAEVKVVSPSGKVYQASAHASEPGAVLQGTIYAARVEQPEAGQWQLLATPKARGVKGGGGYMLYAFYEGGLTVQLDRDLMQVYQSGSVLDLPLTVNGGQVQQARLYANLHDRGQIRVATTHGTLQGRSMRLPRDAGSYTLDLVVTGISADGTPFERTLVTSLAVEGPEGQGEVNR